MKNLIILLSILSAITCLSSCRKGEDDPWLSLRTRKARLTGEWKLTQGEELRKSITSSGEVLIATTTFDGQTSVFTDEFHGYGQVIVNQHEPENYSSTIEFDKKGYYKWVKSEDDLIQTEEGSWSFVGKNKGKDLKNKEAIQLVPLRREQKNPSQNLTYSSEMEGLMGSVYTIRQLKNKEIVLVSETTVDHPNGIDEYDNTYTFSKE